MWQQGIPDDDEDIDNLVNLNDDQKKERKAIRTQNAKAASILLNAVSTDTEKGELAFDMIERYITDEHKAGLFLSSWNDLKQRHEMKDDIQVVDLETAYHSFKMTDEESPEAFIMKKEKKLKKLNNHLPLNRRIDDETFLKHILASLPSSKGKEQLSPYRATRESIEREMRTNAQYTLNDARTALMKVYRELSPDSDDDEDDDQEIT